MQDAYTVLNMRAAFDRLDVPDLRLSGPGQRALGFFIHETLPEIVDQGHDQQGGDGDDGVIAEHVIGRGQSCELGGLRQFLSNGDIVAAERGGHDGGGSGDDARGGQGTHTRLHQHRKEGGQ